MPANKQSDKKNNQQDKPQNNQTSDQVKHIIQNWPQGIQNIVNWMIEQYDQPNQISSTQALWIDNKPWNYSVVSSESIPHKFPYEHGDNLEQTVNYKVPPDKADELLKFNGSLTIRRTRGTLSIESGSEPLNMATLNLAHQICQDQLTVEQARTQLAQTAKQLQNDPDNPPEIAQQIQFNQSQDTPDPDQPHQIFSK